jgi:hypothetical protein
MAHLAQAYRPPFLVIPMKIGIHRADAAAVEAWIRACAGMTVKEK